MKNALLVLGGVVLGVALGAVLLLGLGAPLAAFAQGPVGTPAPYGPGYGHMGGGMMGGGFAGMMGGPQNSLIAVAAKTLGIEQADLVKTLQGGKTIADVAKEKGVVLDKIVDAFIAPRAEWLKTAVANGRLTQAQADAHLAAMKANVNTHLTSAYSPRGTGVGGGFVDANGNGVCDHMESGTQPFTPGGMMGGGMHGRWNR